MVITRCNSIQTDPPQEQAFTSKSNAHNSPLIILFSHHPANPAAAQYSDRQWLSIDDQAHRHSACILMVRMISDAPEKTQRAFSHLGLWCCMMLDAALNWWAVLGSNQ